MASADQVGYRLTTTAEASELYAAGIHRTLASIGGAHDAFQDCLDADPTFALGHAGLGFALLGLGQTKDAFAAFDRADDCVQHATPRERSHVRAVTSLRTGGVKTVDIATEHLAEWPRDRLVAGVRSSALFFCGRLDKRERMVDAARSLRAELPDDWYAHGLLAFALHEVDAFDECLDEAAAALAEEPRSTQALHSIAHVYIETGRHVEGRAFADEREITYERDGALYGHLAWHGALHDLAVGERGSAQRRFEQIICPEQNPQRGALWDAASYLWRLDLDGETTLTAPHWIKVAEAARSLSEFRSLPFLELHAAMAYVATGAFEEARTLRNRWVGELHPAATTLINTIDGFLAFAGHDYVSARKLLPDAHEAVRLGGSNAQRAVIEDTQLEASVRAGCGHLGVATLQRRMGRSASRRDERRLERALG